MSSDKDPGQEDPREQHAEEGRENPQDLDVDRQFAAIVAQWASEAPEPGPATPGGPGPVTDPRDVDSAAEEDAASRPLPREHPPVEPVLPMPWAAPAPDEEIVGGFVPPDPPPLPRGDLVFRLAWAGVIGGPLVVLAVVLLRWDVSSLLVPGGIVAFLAGFVTLIVRLPTERDEDDDGAVV